MANYYQANFYVQTKERSLFLTVHKNMNIQYLKNVQTVLYPHRKYFPDRWLDNQALRLFQQEEHGLQNQLHVL